MKKFLEKRIVKIFNVYINPLIIGGLFSAMGNWDYKNDNYFYIKLSMLVILISVYVYSSLQYYKLEQTKDDKIKYLNALLNKEKNDRINEEKEWLMQRKVLDTEIKSYDRGTRELTTLFVDSSNSINQIAKQILEGKRTLDIWNFKKVATGICSGIYNLLCEICQPYDDFTVNIMLADITATGSKRNITMIAHKGKYEKYPGKFEEKLYFNKNSSFYAVKLCKDSKPEIKILTTKEEVNEKFVYVDEEHPEYSQYVGIPIVCSGNKILCLLQICSFSDNKIANGKAEILDVVKKHIIPFTNYALLSYKVEKSLISSLSIVEKLEGGRKDGEKAIN